MLDLVQIKKLFSTKERRFERNILQEYFQYLILSAVFSSKYNRQLTLMGGTAIKIFYGSDRFSEDLDFTHQEFSFSDFQNLIQVAQKRLLLEGVRTEARSVRKGAYHCYLKIPKILKELNLSPLESEKILIRLDSRKQISSGKSEIKVLNKGTIFQPLRIYKKNALLTQKVLALLNRKRTMGRDIYDLVYLAAFTEPDWEILRKEAKIQDKQLLKGKLLSFLKDKDLRQLAEDIKPFLINEENVQRILYFKEWIKQWSEERLMVNG